LVSDQDPSSLLLNILCLIGIFGVLLIHVFERYNMHVIDRTPFMDFNQ
jgi:hypothetical protein